MTIIGRVPLSVFLPPGKEAYSMTKDLTSGQPMRLILGFTLPTLCGVLFQQLYNLVDTMIVGKLLGAQALAAVGSVGSINFLVIGFCMGVCSGFAIPVAQRVGAGDPVGMRRYAANAARLAVVFAVVLALGAGALCRWVLTAMDTPADIFDGAYAYILVIFLGIPTVFLYNLPAGILRSLGDSRTPVYFLALSSGLNIALDLLFILVCRAGVAGAAVATVISQGVSGAACLVYMRKKYPILRPEGEEGRPDAAACRTLCAMGLPMGLQYSVTAVGSIILQSAVNGLGSFCVAAMTAASRVSNLLTCPFDAMGSAMTTYCGQNVGARKLDRLGQGIRACTLLGLIYSAAALVFVLAFSTQCAMLFLDPRETRLDLLIGMSRQYLVALTAFFFPLALIYVLRFSIQGMGFSNLAVLAGVMEMAARTVFGRMVVPALGYDAACFASPTAWVCADLFLIPACAGCILWLRRREGQHGPRLQPRRRAAVAGH